MPEQEDTFQDDDFHTNASPSDEESLSFSPGDFALPAVSTLRNGFPEEEYPRPVAVEQGTNLRNIQDLNVLELLSVLLHSPRTTGKVLWDLLEPEALPRTRLIDVGRFSAQSQTDVRQIVPITAKIFSLVQNPQIVRIIFWISAFVLTLIGNRIFVDGEIGSRRDEAIQLAKGSPFLMAGFLLYLFGEILTNWAGIQLWWNEKSFLSRLNVILRLFPIGFILIGLSVIKDSTQLSPEYVLEAITPGIQLILLGIATWMLLDLGAWGLRLQLKRKPDLFPVWIQQEWDYSLHTTVSVLENADRYRDLLPWYMKIHPLRLISALGGMILSVLVWYGTTGNEFSTLAFYLWLLSAFLWSMTFVPRGWNPFVWLATWRNRIEDLNLRSHLPTLIALLLIIGLAFHFRFHDLRQHPREMTDDHVEKILDAGLVRDGSRPIFFANNGGREPFQMYAIALASYLPGLGINHFTIKVVAAIESLLTIPILFWMGYEILEGETKQRRVLVGLMVAGLTAASYWHVAITRQGLRIGLTPLVASLLLIYLARALRRNTRADFVKVGLILGFGLYTYQAVRMLPVVIVLAVALAVYFVARNWKSRLRYILNLVVLVWISFVIFIPMFHYSVEYPDLFWRRTAGRLFGDDVLEEALPDGRIVMRDATFDEQLQAFQHNVPILVNNFRNVLLMFNWKGDVAAISGIPNHPAMDFVSGTFLIIGLSAWVVLMARRRDVVHWVIPLFILLMLLPSALSIAFPVENPSHTRTSGAIPGIYLIAALPLALIAEWFLMVPPKRIGRIVAVAVCFAAVILSYSINAYAYFNVYPRVYADSFDPYSEPGDYLRGFVLSGGSYGNAFLIGYPHWWSHRAVGLAGGLETMWPNGIVNRTDIPHFLHDQSNRTDRFRFDPNRDIVFFVSPNDLETADYLAELFPDGYANLEHTYALNNDYVIYRVPALGQSVFDEWLQENLQ